LPQRQVSEEKISFPVRANLITSTNNRYNVILLLNKEVSGTDFMAQNVTKGGVGTVVILSLSPRRLGFYFPNPQWPFSVTRVANAVYIGRGLGFGKVLRQVNILIYTVGTMKHHNHRGSGTSPSHIRVRKKGPELFFPSLTNASFLPSL
jgi:hypothetical protein